MKSRSIDQMSLFVFGGCGNARTVEFLVACSVQVPLNWRSSRRMASRAAGGRGVRSTWRCRGEGLSPPITQPRPVPRAPISRSSSAAVFQ